MGLEEVFQNPLRPGAYHTRSQATSLTRLRLPTSLRGYLPSAIRSVFHYCWRECCCLYDRVYTAGCDVGCLWTGLGIVVEVQHVSLDFLIFLKSQCIDFQMDPPKRIISSLLRSLDDSLPSSTGPAMAPSRPDRPKDLAPCHHSRRPPYQLRLRCGGILSS